MTDTQPFEAFLNQHQNMVYSTAMRLLAKQSDAEDITQEVFLRAFQNYASLAGNPSAGGWLRTVATNLSLNHLKRYRSRWSVFTDVFTRTNEEGDEQVVEVIAESALGGDQQLVATERRQAIERALQSLPDKQRVPLVLHHFQGLGYEEIAAELGISLAKVKTDIFRGREVLRRTLRLELGEDATGGTAT